MLGQSYTIPCSRAHNTCLKVQSKPRKLTLFKSINSNSRAYLTPTHWVKAQISGSQIGLWHKTFRSIFMNCSSQKSSKTPSAPYTTITRPYTRIPQEKWISARTGRLLRATLFNYSPGLFSPNSSLSFLINSSFSQSLAFLGKFDTRHEHTSHGRTSDLYHIVHLGWARLLILITSKFQFLLVGTPAYSTLSIPIHWYILSI